MSRDHHYSYCYHKRKASFFLHWCHCFLSCCFMSIFSKPFNSLLQKRSRTPVTQRTWVFRPLWAMHVFHFLNTIDFCCFVQQNPSNSHNLSFLSTPAKFCFPWSKFPQWLKFWFLQRNYSSTLTNYKWILNGPDLVMHFHTAWSFYSLQIMLICKVLYTEILKNY